MKYENLEEQYYIEKDVDQTAELLITIAIRYYYSLYVFTLLDIILTENYYKYSQAHEIHDFDKNRPEISCSL